MNIGSLYYRKDLLSAQGYTSESDFDTWSELKEAANAVLAASDNSDLVGYVGQFDAYEGGTVNMIEWIGSNGATEIFDNQGRIDVTDPQIEEALTFLKGSIAPRYTGVLDTEYFIARDALVSDEGSSVGKFTAGNAVFMRQWTFGYPASQSAEAINDTNTAGEYTQFGVMPLPTFDGNANQKSCCVGGAVLAIPVFSNNQEQAVKLVRFLGDEVAQKAELEEVGNFPALETVYDDFTGDLAWAKELVPSFEKSIARPIHPKYSQLSTVLSGTFNDIISCQLEVESGLEQMESDAASAIKAQPAPEPIIPGFSVFYLLVAGTSMIAAIVVFLRKRFE
jgi:ABC-type glycerol-3-phosphate transport system substrate-binding protein